ncbi:hypothetical protein BP6252_11793 [Coleophoma cylindrospora]|uniref:Uncharacterized protein n=1 Tax=Coleophoma cylindrospora TaxID=1849047 RepID=A0A3D8QL21_9HELO|nr:hypothetical protein BP6252_11793 [Coleophoma cylindrospora]
MVSPDAVLENWKGMVDDDFEVTIRTAFDLPPVDDYVYAAESFQMTLAQVQESMATGMLTWNYWSPDHPPQRIPIPDSDVTAYTSIFSPTTDTAKSLKSFEANAKKSSPRALISSYLNSRRLVPSDLKIPKSKQHLNPYYDIWTWSCLKCHFIGPTNDSSYAHPTNAKRTHPMLPILYHHFGCVCPSYEALSVISYACNRVKSDGVLDMASGNGFWTYMLRRHGVKCVAVDNMEAKWRYMWIDDTIKANGVTYLKQNNGAQNQVLLMVYMVTRGDFTKQVLKAYKGSVIVIAGTQNANRFTSFGDVTVEEYFAKDMPSWELAVRVALPSFAGKDEGLFVYERKK